VRLRACGFVVMGIGMAWDGVVGESLFAVC
jgi:hypothetical protein